MKKLSNISPFILLLIPVFIMALLTIKTAVAPSVNNALTALTK